MSEKGELDHFCNSYQQMFNDVGNDGFGSSFKKVL